VGYRMLGIQLDALSAQELRRLLDVARARGQDGLARQLEAELAARPGRTAGQPLPMSATPRALPRRAPVALAPARRRRGPAVAVAGLAAFIGAAVAWGISLNPPQKPPRPQAVALTNTAPAPRIAVALTTTAAGDDPADASNHQADDAEAAPAPAPLSVEPRTENSPGRNPCYDLPTARERLICGYPSVAIQDRRMQAALDRARANGGDVRAIDDAQAAWQSSSANIQDRQVLMDRYARRIAELEAE